MTSDDQERMAIDKAALELLGWTNLEYNGVLDFRGRSPAGTYFYATPSPSLEAAFVVPLTEALRAKGWCVGMQMVPGGWEVTLDGPTIGERSRLVQAEGSHLELALAIAAARAMENANG